MRSKKFKNVEKIGDLEEVNLTLSRVEKLRATQAVAPLHAVAAMKGRPVLVWSQNGRFGNHMFQYASAYCLTKLSGHVILINNDSDILEVFPHIKALRASNQDFFRTVLTSVHEMSAGKYDSRLENRLVHMANVRLSGYLQSWKYLTGCEEDIKQQFTIQNQLAAVGRKHFVHLLKNSSRPEDSVLLDSDLTSQVFVGVHVRRGDMASSIQRARGYIAAPLSYIEQAMHYYRQKYPAKILFVVVSDDMPWCQENISQERRDVIFAGSGSHVVDLATLVSCNHSIITSGTFGWWAGWLTGGSVMYYSKYPVPNTSIGRQYSQEDYYPTDWIPME